MLERFGGVDLHPDQIDNATMGTIFEELIRRFNEALNENPGEHFTPRDVVHLMVDLMLAGDEASIGGRGVVRTVYDPCCGSGGMLMIAKEHINTQSPRKRQPAARSSESRCRDSPLTARRSTLRRGRFPSRTCSSRNQRAGMPTTLPIGTTLSSDAHAARSFDYLIANPPYGKDWKRDERAVRAEHERGALGRFGPGLPRISDGQLLFLLHMLAHAKDPQEGGSRICHHHERLTALHR